jgi:serine/threonine-protein kinase
MRRLFEELKRRRVFRAVLLYLLIGFPAIELLDIVLPAFDVPPWVNRTILVIYLSGFPVAILVAWFIQVTPDGIKAHHGDDHYGNVTDFFMEGGAARSVHEEGSVYLKGEKAAGSPMPDPKSLAVLPLENLSPNPANAYFASGVHEEILDQLAKISDLKVKSRTAVLRYQDTTETPSRIARELNVGWIMEGTVRFSKQRARITTELISANDDIHKWSETYDFELDDIFLVQSEVAKKVAVAMQATLLPAEEKRIDRPATVNSLAYTLFLQHRFQYAREHARPTLEEDGWVASGIRKMEQAIALDPMFARGIAEMGWLTWYKGLLSGISKREAIYDEAIRYARQALEIDPYISRAYQVLHRVYFHRRDWDSWEKYARKSAQLPDPDGSSAFNLTLTLSLSAHYAEANYWIEEALAKNPTFDYYWEVAVTTRISGADYEKALELTEHYLAVGGDTNGYHAARAYCFYRLGDDAAFQAEYQAVENHKLECVFFNQFMDFVRSANGEKDAVVAEIMATPDDYTTPSRLIHAGAAVDDLDLVFAAYQAIMDHNAVVHFSDVISDEIRNDERFARVEEYMILPRPGEYIDFLAPG